MNSADLGYFYDKPFLIVLKVESLSKLLDLSLPNLKVERASMLLEILLDFFNLVLTLWFGSSSCFLGCRLSERVLAIDLAGLLWFGSSSGFLGSRLSERDLAIDFATAQRLGLLLSFAVSTKGPSKRVIRPMRRWVKTIPRGQTQYFYVFNSREGRC